MNIHAVRTPAISDCTIVGKHDNCTVKDRNDDGDNVVFFPPEMSTNCSQLYGVTASVKFCDTSFEYVTYMYVITTICIVGFLLNVTNIAVFHRRAYFRVSNSTFTFLVALAVSELGYLVLSSGMGPSRCLSSPADDWEKHARFMYEIVCLPAINSFGAASVWLTVIVAIERYTHVQHLYTARIVFSKKLTKVYIVFIYFSAIIIHVPFYFAKGISQSEGKEALITTTFGKSDGFEIFLWIRMAVVKIIPIATIAIFNVLMIRAVCLATRQTRVMVFPNTLQVRRQRMQHRLTAMLISISLLLIVCHVIEPFIHAGLYVTILGPCSIYKPAYAIQTCLVNALEAFSFAINFVFYCIFHPQFRLALKQLLHLATGRPKLQQCDPEMSVSRVFSLQQ